MKDFIKKYIARSIETKTKVLNNTEILDSIEKAAAESVKAYRAGNKLMFAGNGGSAADAQHFAGEMVSRFYFDRPGLPAIALTTDTSILTAAGNDYGFEKIFSRQIEANGVRGDVFFAISTSGNSPNILKAIEACKLKGILTVALTGGSGGAMKSICDITIIVPSPETPIIQESHEMIGHMICALIEEEMFGRSR
jgi:D-sedoheptulose 7-phosphate isomerase